MFRLLLCPSGAVLRRTSSLVRARCVLVALLLALPAATVRAQPASNDGFEITGVNLANFQIVNDVLTASGTVTGTLAGLPFTTQITNFALQLVDDDPTTEQVECSVLHLELAPIHLALLGLHVDTSAICLDVTATPGGGILGDLLCGLAGGIPLLELPDLTQVGALERALEASLEAALGQNLVPAQDAQDSVCTGDCEILELVLGPLNLSLLGLNVSLDDCEEGPVQVCISASRGEGILGSLLCGLSNTDLLNLTLADIARLTRRALALLGDGQLSGRDIAELRALLRQLIVA